MTSEDKPVDQLRRIIVLGGPAAVGFASASVLTGCGSAPEITAGTQTAEAPSFTPGTGTYNSAQTVALATPTPSAAIYYTVDGSVPTTASAAYVSPIAITESKTVLAIAAAKGWDHSGVGSATFTIDMSSTPAQTPTFAPAGGTYASTQTVSISTQTPGAQIYYTKDGSTPTAASTAYSSAITVSTSETLQAMAMATGFANSAVGSAIYTIDDPTPTADTPTFSPAGGTYTSAQTVTISSATAGAKIYYTTNGTTPTTSSTAYASAIAVSASGTLKAIATASGSADSAVASASFTIDASLPITQTPTFSPAAGTYTGAQTVSISSATTGAKIYYTTNGTTPTTSSTAYSAAITVSASETVHALAIAAGYADSAVGSAAYTINASVPTAATPTFSPAGGTFTSAQTVTISSATAGAKIYYTTNGTTPTTSSTAYSAPIAVSASETLQAIAVATGYANSAVGTASFTINAANVGYDGVISVSGAALVNGAGTTIQLRGANIQDYAQCMIIGYEDASGGTAVNDQAHGPNTTYLAEWKMNAIRIGINESSWLGYECYTTAANGNGSTGWINPDPYTGANSYAAQITAQIEALNAIGCYAILTLAFSNPGRSAALGQDYMANQDNSITCWQSLAATYGYPNGTALKKNGGTVDDRSVIFELYNEPAMYGEDAGNWDMLMNGGLYNGAYFGNYYGNLGLPYTNIFPYPCATPVGSGFIPGETVSVNGTAVGKVLCYYVNTTTGLPSSGTKFVHIYNSGVTSAPAVASGDTITGSVSGTTASITGPYGWYVAGHAQMLAAIRAAGAWNVCLLSGDQYNQDISEWATYAPTDLTLPAGYNGPGWTPQIGACWHPYPAWSYISSAAISAGGSGYAVGDTILLPMPESGASANSVYWQAQLQVTAVSGGAITAVQVNAYNGGIPGIEGGNSGQFSSHSSGGSPIGGAYSNLMLPSNPVPQSSTSGKGTGATFNLSFTSVSGPNWPNSVHWSVVAALVTTRLVPVVITETGEHFGTGVSGSPWMAALTSFCDTNGISMVCYAYTPSAGWTDLSGGDYGLVDGNHNPTPGYGAFMYNWFTTHAP